MRCLYFTVAIKIVWTVLWWGLEEQSVLFPAVMAEVSVLKLLGTERRIWKRMKDQMWEEFFFFFKKTQKPDFFIVKPSLLFFSSTQI